MLSFGSPGPHAVFLAAPGGRREHAMTWSCPCDQENTVGCFAECLEQVAKQVGL